MESYIVVILLHVAFVLAQRTGNFDINSCRVQLSCGGGEELSTRGDIGPAGRDGKRGPQGIRGPKGGIGVKGAKGAPCDCDEQVLELKQQINSLMVQTCPQTKFKFRGGHATDWIRVKVPIQDITSATFCSWITPPSGSRIKGSYISYNTLSQDNEFVAFFTDTHLNIYVGGKSSGGALAITRETHLCITTAPTLGWTKIIINGRFQFSLTPTSSRRPIAGGGNLLLGQEQDSFMGSFDATQAISGTIKNFMLWYRILDDSEMFALYNNPCSCPKDYAIDFTPDQIQLEGVVASLPVDKC